MQDILQGERLALFQAVRVIKKGLFYIKEK